MWKLEMRMKSLRETSRVEMVITTTITTTTTTTEMVLEETDIEVFEGIFIEETTTRFEAMEEETGEVEEVRIDLGTRTGIHGIGEVKVTLGKTNGTTTTCHGHHKETLSLP